MTPRILPSLWCCLYFLLFSADIINEAIILLIDFHTHCFPDKLAEKAIERLSYVSGGLKPNTDGSLEGLRRSMRSGKVDVSVVLNIATNAHQQASVNSFAESINNNKDIISFGSVFPFAEDALERLEEIKAMGLKGVKLHPDYQGFEVNDIRLKPLYRKISELGLITVFHAGLDYGFAPPYGATPEKLAQAIDWFDSPVVAAHWGGLGCGEGVLEHLCGKELYFDTSFGYGQMPRYYAQKIIERHGTDKILFGTDTPWHTPEMELTLLITLNLSEIEMDKITHLNAQKLLGL